jgi:hypothetical protein
MYRTKILRFFLITAFLISGYLSVAQKFSATVSKNRVAVGEQFELTFTLSGNGSNFKPPQLNDFNVYFGPSQSSSVQIINGNMSQSIGFSYVIAAKREGKITIQPASIIVNGAKLESNFITIEVVKGSAGQAQSSGGLSEEDINNNLFVRTIISKQKAYLGEQIMITHKVYTRLNLKGFQDVKFPSYNGFFVQDLSKQPQITLQSENLDGIVYNVAELKKAFLFPQRTGNLQIEPVVVECVVRQRSNRQPQSVFDQLFGNGGVEDRTYSIKSKAMNIEVQALPELNKPKGFEGAVGNFSFKATLDRNKLKANEGATLKITVSGRGNLKLLNAPVIEFPQDVESYDPKTKDDIVITTNGVSGSKTFEYFLIPRHEGEYKIDKIQFSYFDPEKRSYVTIPSPEFVLQVDKADKENASPGLVVAKDDVKMLGNDIRYIKTNKIELKEKGHYFFGSTLFVTGLVVPLISFVLLLFFRRRHLEMNKDINLVKNRQAGKMAKKRLLLAEKHMKQNNKEEFYNEIYLALNGYLSYKLGIPVSDLSREIINSDLQRRKISKEVIEDLNNAIQQCEFAKYASSAVSDDLLKVYNQAAEVITKIENELK